MVDIIGTIIRTGQGIVKAVVPVITRPPIQVIAPIVRQAPRIVQQVTSPYFRQGAQLIQQAPRVVQQIPRMVQQAPRIVQRAPRMVQQGFDAGSRFIQRTPLAAVNTAGQYAGNIIRARQLPNRQQVMNAGATIMRQTPLAPAVQMGYQYQRQGGVQRTMNQASRVIQRTPLAPINTAGQYAGNIIRARQLPNRQQVMNAGANIMRQTPLAPVVNAGQRARQTINRNGGMQAAINRGSALFQRTPLAAFNTAGQYAGNVIRAGRAPTTQQVFNAGATIMRQTPLAPVVNAGQRARQTINRNGGMQAAINRGSDLFQRTPLAAVNTAGRYAGDVLRSGRLPSTQQVMNAGATIMRQTPLAPVVNAGQQARQTIVRNGGMQAAINRGSDIFQRTPFAAANTLGRYTGDVLRSGRLPSTRQFVSGAGTIARQLNPVPRASGGNIVPMGNLTAPAQDWIGRVEGRNQTINQMQADAKAKGWWKNGMVAPPATSEGLNFLNNYQTAIDSMKREYDTGAGTYLFSNNSTFKPQYVQQNQTAAQPAATAPRQQSGGWLSGPWNAMWGSLFPGSTPAAPAPRPASQSPETDIFGAIGRRDALGALGATGNVIAGTAEGVSSWWTNRATNTMNVPGNLGPLYWPGLGSLSRGELPAARAFDARNRRFWDEHPVALGTYSLLMHRDPRTYDTTQNLGKAAQLFTDTAGSAFVLGVAGGVLGATRFAQDVGTEATVRKNPVGAAGKIGEGAVNFAVGMPMWFASAPGRVAADPVHAPFELMGEWYSGKILAGGGVRGLRAAKGAALNTGGRTIGLVNPDVIVHSERSFLPQSTWMDQWHHLQKPSSEVVAHASAGVMSWFPWGKVRTSLVTQEGHGVPSKFVTWGRGNGVVETSRVIAQRTEGRPFLWKIGAKITGPRVNLFHNVPHVKAPESLWNRARTEYETSGKMSKATFTEFERLAMDQSRQLGQPVLNWAPKRTHKGDFQPENEAMLVFGSEATRNISRKKFGGYTKEGIRITNVALGSQQLPRGTVGQLGRNFKRQFDVEYVPHLGVRNTNVMNYWAQAANYKANVVTGRQPAGPRESDFYAHGTRHMENVQQNLDFQRRTDPKLGQVLSPEGAWIISRGHDIGKLWAGDSIEPHGPLAAGLIRTGRIDAFRDPYSRLPKQEQRSVTRAIALHTDIKPHLRQKGGLRTVMQRPDIVAKATANADRWDLTRFGHDVDPAKLFSLDRWSWLGPEGPDLSTMTPISVFGGGWFARGRFIGTKTGRNTKRPARRGGRTAPNSRERTTPLDSWQRLYRRSRSRTYEPRRAKGYPQNGEPGVYPTSTDYLSRTIGAAEAYVSYGSKNRAVTPGYREPYRRDRGYGTNYPRVDLGTYPRGYNREYVATPSYPVAAPPSYPPSKPPTYPPVQPPTYPPSKPPTYPPVQPPTYPPSKPPTYPPVQPPTYPPSKPPTYPPVQPPTYPPSKPPTYPPVQPPTYPPSKPPTYPPVQPPTYPPTYPPTKPPYQPPYPPYEPPYEPPVPPIIPPYQPQGDTPEGRQSLPRGGMFAFDFGEKLGVYSPERMFSKRTKKDRIFGMTYTRRKKKAKSFLG